MLDGRVQRPPNKASLARGDDAPCMPIEEAVRDVVTYHLSPPDPYLSAAVCGGSSLNTHVLRNTRVLRQEETADGHQQALGRHLGHRASAE